MQSLKNKSTKTNPSRQAIRDEQEIQEQYQYVRSNVNQLIFEMNTLNQRLYTHKHDDYQKQIDQIKDENRKLKADYQLLKQDNQELLFINSDLKRIISQIEQVNQVIIQTLTQQGCESNRSSESKNTSGYYIPYDESKIQEAEILLNRFKQL